MNPPPRPDAPREKEGVNVVITDVRIPFNRAVYLVGFWWAASLVFGVIVGIFIGTALAVWHDITGR